MTSNNILTDINDLDNILLDFPQPVLVISVKSNNILLSGNFSIENNISKISYLGSSKNKNQEFSIKNIVINFEINDSKNSQDFNIKIDKSTSDLFIINNEFKIPNYFNLNNLKIDSFNIIANYINNNNIVSSVIKVNNIILDNFEVEDVEEYEENNNIIENGIIKFIKSIIIPRKLNSKLELYDSHTPPSDPYITLYWLVPLSIILCVGFYYYNNNSNYFKRNYFSSESSDGQDDDVDNYESDGNDYGKDNGVGVDYGKDYGEGNFDKYTF
jgi:hypothetical protein